MAIIPSTQKILTSNEAVNTTYGGSQALKELNTWYTMEDISNTVKPYKVFTALLTQSGSDGAAQGISSSPLIIGATYYIEDNGGSGWDFTNVGAPNNDLFTYFVATGENPNSWGIDGLLGYTPGAPVATVLENTIGNVWFSYNGNGMYIMNSASLFTFNKTIGFAGGQQFGNATGDPVFIMYLQNINEISIETPSGMDDMLIGAPIEIRVYS
jgi:hypothetical protein